jgi:hypothetical protein
MENHGGMISTGKSNSSTRALWQSCQQSYRAAKQEELCAGNDKFCLKKYLFHASRVSLTWRKILGQGTDGFTSPTKEGMLLIFIQFTLKFGGDEICVGLRA